jgi:hypothetical protein
LYLSVSTRANLREFENPTEWKEYYASGDNNVVFECLSPFDVEPPFVIYPGDFRAFSFTASVPPATTSFAVDGINFSDDDEAFFKGTVIGPAQAPNDPADLNNDGTVNAVDVDLLRVQILTSGMNPKFDLNSDSRIDSLDLTRWVRDLKRTWFGDANLDGRFDSGDLVQVFQGGEYEDEIVGSSTWSTGDWNADGEFSTSDLVAAFQDGGYEQGPRPAASSVPEPNQKYLILSAMWGIGLFRGCTLRRWCCGFDCCLSSAKD